nr:unnamed protein product [Spirometra erinaceieuropaei]
MLRLLSVPRLYQKRPPVMGVDENSISLAIKILLQRLNRLLPENDVCRFWIHCPRQSAIDIRQEQVIGRGKTFLRSGLILLIGY